MGKQAVTNGMPTSDPAPTVSSFTPSSAIVVLAALRAIVQQDKETFKALGPIIVELSGIRLVGEDKPADIQGTLQGFGKKLAVMGKALGAGSFGEYSADRYDVFVEYLGRRGCLQLTLDHFLANLILPED